MRFGVNSDKGIVREINEDSYNVIAGDARIPVSFIVADGMGGHNSGEIASRMAVQYISSRIMEAGSELDSEEQIPAAIEKFIKDANSYIYSASRDHKDNTGMGTTVIVAVARRGILYIGHVGDSRVYVIRGSSMSRITTDHSFIEELIKSGTLTREEAENHPKRNVITRALGCEETIKVDIYTSEIKEDDIFLICTDGLTNMVDEDDIKEIILSTDDPEAACNKLVNTANEKGGSDNITVVVFKNDEKV